MRSLIILLYILITDVSSAQQSLSLQGTWNLLTIKSFASSYNDSLYYDIRKDSIIIPNKDIQDAKKDGLDSIQTVDLFKSMYKSLKDLRVIFIKDSVQVEANSFSNKGTFKIINKQTLQIILMVNGEKQEYIEYSFILNGNILDLLKKTDIGYDKFTLLKE